MIVLAVCIRARWVIHTPYVCPLLHWTGVYPGYRAIPLPTRAMGANSRVRPVEHWAEKLDRASRDMPNAKCLPSHFNNDPARVGNIAQPFLKKSIYIVKNHMFYGRVAAIYKHHIKSM